MNILENMNPEVQTSDTESTDIIDTGVIDTSIDTTDTESVEANDDTGAGADGTVDIDIDALKGFTPLIVESIPRSSSSANGVASFTVVNSQKGNGNRLTFTETLYTALDKPKSLQFSISDSVLAIASELPGVEERYTFKSPDIHILYNKALVVSIAKAFNLDYSDGKTSYSFRNIEYKNVKNGNGDVITVALITMVVE